MTEKQFSLHVKTWLAHNKNHFEIDIVDERITPYQIRPFSSKRNLFDSLKNKPLSKLISLKNSSTFPQRQLISCSSEVSISEIEIIGLQPPVHFGHHFFCLLVQIWPPSLRIGNCLNYIFYQKKRTSSSPAGGSPQAIDFRLMTIRPVYFSLDCCHRKRNRGHVFYYFPPVKITFFGMWITNVSHYVVVCWISESLWLAQRRRLVFGAMRDANEE